MTPLPRTVRTLLWAAAPALLLAPAAQAHTGHALGGLEAGAAHPLLGADHVAAMVAVGLWAAALGGRALLALPAAFLGAMALGGAAGMAGLTLPGLEAGIALSGLVLGLLAAFALRAPLGASAALVAAFALLHGLAHGAEMPGAASPLPYAAGFVAATAALHLAGVALGRRMALGGGAASFRGLAQGAGLVAAAVGGAALLGVA